MPDRPPTTVHRPIRVLELRSVRGTGGGPEKTILLGAALADPVGIAVTVCYLRAQEDPQFAVDERARKIGVDYVEIRERHSFDPTILWKLRTLVKQRQIDIVHSHEYKTDLLALALKRLDGVVPLATVHGWTGRSLLERRLYYPADKRLLRAFPRLIAVSSQIRDELIRTGTRSEAITVVLNGIDPAVFIRDRRLEEAARMRFGVARDDIVIGGLGRLEEQKRFDLLLHAFAGASSGRPNLRLIIAGDGSLREELERLAHRLGLGDRVRFLGHVTDVVALHHALDLFVQSSDYEGTANALLEAMALETPVVATDVGGTAEVIENGIEGKIVPPNDLAALTREIVSAVTNPASNARMTSAARERIVAKLSFERRVKQVEAIYREVLMADGRYRC